MKLRRKLVGLILLLSMALSGSTLSAPTPALSGSLRDDTGARIARAPVAQRIVSLAPHLTETLLDLSAQAQLVGTIDGGHYPAELAKAAARIARVGGISGLDAEKILALRPDLVVYWVSGTDAAQVARLKELLQPFGTRWFGSEPSNLPAVATLVEQLGELTGHAQKARLMANTYRARLASLQAANKGKPLLRVFYQLWASPLMTINGTHWLSDALRQCGAHNVFDGLPAKVPLVDLEAVIAAAPEAIVLSSDAESGRPEALRLREVSPWTALQGRLLGFDPPVLTVSGKFLTRPSLRVLNGVEDLCRALRTQAS